MTVTTGERMSRASIVSSSPLSPISTSASLTRLTLWPNSSTMSCAVSASIDCVMVTTVSISIRRFTTSAPRTAMRLASSCTVIASGTTTSRTTGLSPSARIASRARRFSRSRWRRSDARLRPRCSPTVPSRASESLILPPRRRGWSRREGLAGRRCSPRRRGLPRSSSAGAAPGRAGRTAPAAPGAAAASALGSSGCGSLRAASSSALLRASSSALRRSSSSLFRRSAWACSAACRSSSTARRRASSTARSRS